MESKFGGGGGGGMRSIAAFSKIMSISTDLAISKSILALSLNIPAKLANSDDYAK